MTMRRVNLAYDVVSPNGDTQRNLPPIILLHGMMDSRKTWKAFAPKIAKETGRIVYAYDARNHGESEWSDEFNFEILVSDLEKFMDDREIRRAILIGHSMGGKTALTLALKQPQRVEKLIVEDMAVRNWRLRPGTSNTFSQLISLLRESLICIPQGATLSEAQKAIVNFTSALMPADHASGNKSSFDSSTVPLKQEKDGKFSWQANLDVLEDVLLNLDKLKQTLSGVYLGDALFLYGPKSVFKVDQDSQIPLFFPRSQRIPIEGATHMLHSEYPEQFLHHVATFILSGPPVKSKY